MLLGISGGIPRKNHGKISTRTLKTTIGDISEGIQGQYPVMIPRGTMKVIPGKSLLKITENSLQEIMETTASNSQMRNIHNLKKELRKKLWKEFLEKL